MSNKHKVDGFITITTSTSIIIINILHIDEKQQLKFSSPGMYLFVTWYLLMYFKFQKW